MRNALLWILLLTLYGCKSAETSLNLVEQVPQSVKDLVYQSYPGAGPFTDISELEKDKVYELSFGLDRVNYSAIVSRSNILSVTRTSGEQVPDALAAKLEGLAIKGGELSNYRIVEDADGKNVAIADYLLNGSKYVIQFNDWGLSLQNYEKTFETRNLQDLPEGIQQFIAQRNRANPQFVNSLTNLNYESRQYIIKNNELTFSNCWIRIMPDGTKQYYVSVNYFGATNLPILFNENSKIIWTGFFNRLRKFEQDFNGTPAMWLPNLTSREIAFFKDFVAGSSQLLGFNFDNFANFNKSYRNEYENNVGYQLELSNKRYEYWHLYFNADKQIIGSQYQANY